MSQVSVWSGHGGHRSQQKCGKFIKQRCPFPSSFLFSLLRCLCKVKTKMCACVCFCSMIRNTWTYAVVFIVIQSSDYFAQHCVESSVLDCVQENCRVPAVLLTVVQRRCLKKKKTQRRLKCLCIVSVRDLTEVTLSWHADLGVGNLSEGPKNRQVWQTACVCLK